jgi:hypothetical protein
MKEGRGLAAGAAVERGFALGAGATGEQEQDER